MRLRHAGAIGLVGWYLMIPPMYPGYKVDLDAPLSEWQVQESFETKGACSHGRSALVRKYPVDNEFLRAGALGKRAAASQCVEGDDPRLK